MRRDSHTDINRSIAVQYPADQIKHSELFLAISHKFKRAAFSMMQTKSWINETATPNHTELPAISVTSFIVVQITKENKTARGTL